MASGQRTRRQQLGAAAEARACAFLEGNGLRIVERNFNCRHGELDVIACDGKVLIFVEVRSRRHRSFGGASASVDMKKQQRLIRAAQFWLQCEARWRGWPARFDVITFDGEQAEINWLQSAFSAA